jgi:hypothetical protein
LSNIKQVPSKSESISKLKVHNPYGETYLRSRSQSVKNMMVGVSTRNLNCEKALRNVKKSNSLISDKYFN